nr:transposase (putative), gypsy type [Tanacetum cinerariifolium]
MGTIDGMKSSLTQSALDALCKKFHIPRTVHPELPGRNQRIHNSPTSKIDVYTRFFYFSNYRIPLSQFLVDVLMYFQINMSQLSVIAAAKNNKIVKKDPHPTPTEFNAKVCYFLATHPARFQKFPESFLCLVGISRYYELDDNVYPVFLADDDEDGCSLFASYPIKGRIGEKQIEEGQVPLLESTRGRVLLLAGENPIDAEIVRIEDKVSTAILDKPKGRRNKRKTASGSAIPHKRTREDCGTSDDAGASTAGKSIVVLQDLLESSTLAAETQHPDERSVISSDSSYYSSANATDDEVTSIIKSSVPLPPVLTAAVATTAIVGATFALVHESRNGPVQRSIFRDSASPSTAGTDIVGPSQPAGAKVSTDTFYISQEMDFETLQQTYVPKWNVINDSALDDPDEAEAVEAIRLRSQVATIEGTKAARVNELNSLKGKTTALEGQVVALESATVIKDAELASSNAQISKLTQDLSNFQLSCDELSIKATSLESEKDKLTNQVSLLETTCFGLPGRRWILSHGLRLVVMKCFQSLKYLADLGGAISCAIDKVMQDGLAAGIDHKKAERGLADVAAYNPSTEANYVSAVNALRVVDFPLLAQLASQKMQPSRTLWVFFIWKVL